MKQTRVGDGMLGVLCAAARSAIPNENLQDMVALDLRDERTMLADARRALRWYVFGRLTMAEAEKVLARTELRTTWCTCCTHYDHDYDTGDCRRCEDCRQHEDGADSGTAPA